MGSPGGFSDDVSRVFDWDDPGDSKGQGLHTEVYGGLLPKGT